MMLLPTIGQFLMVLMAFCTQGVTCSNGNYTDKVSLLEFKNSISDPRQALISWNDSTHLCSWEGVQCSVKHPLRVTSLRLINQGLVGPISPSHGNLTFLKVLILSANLFVGEIPPSLGHLHRLQILKLNNNTIQGTIPSLSNCSNLKGLFLEVNQLAGQIPEDLLFGLQKLALAVNNLTGNIPSSLANITTLNAFTCIRNNIQGNIPNEFTKLSALQILYVSVNKLSGPFPQPVLNLSNLLEFRAASNDFSGEVPPNIGNSLPNLQLLQLGLNFFHGHIPSSLTNASKLTEIDISRNSFSGAVPGSIGKLSQLSWLNLEVNKLRAKTKQDLEFLKNLANCTGLRMFSAVDNRLEGNLQMSLGNLSSELQHLHLSVNQLSGDFPSSIANLGNLLIVELAWNQFTGVVPAWLGAMKNLQKVSLGNNFFTGIVPSSLSNLSQLVELYLQSNQLKGHIPQSLSNLQMLQVLSISDNSLHGSIPQSLSNLQMLEVLSISNNSLHGSIPKELFNIPTLMQISFSLNNLDGPLHPDIGNAKQFTFLHLSRNNLSGEIPRTLGNCESLIDMKLGHNSFNGSIPTSLGNISSLQVLNLSHNNLTGSIPVSLGSLQLLQLLDLSFNHLEGEVPTNGIFSNVTAVQIDGNSGLCGGEPKMHLLACPIKPLDSRKHKHSIVQKLVIILASMMSLAIVLSVVLLWRGKQKRKSLSLPSINNQFPKVSYNDLARATDGFSTSKLIGKGRYSSVYQGELFPDRIVVAVKVFSLDTRGAQKSFIAECNALRNVRHRNLVPILTACSSIDSRGNDFKALVYKFMQRGDLHALLYLTRGDANTSTPSCITLAQRLNTVTDVADALEYLHHNNQGTIVHCDLKPSNILLDDNMTAHIGDFGLARFKVGSGTPYSGDSISTSSVAIKGTIGYVAPECAGGGEVSSAGDVYSFGIVLLEIFMRKRPTDDMFKDGVNIARFVETNFPDRIAQIVDPELLEEHDDVSQQTSSAMTQKKLECLISVLNNGLRCAKLLTHPQMSAWTCRRWLQGCTESRMGI
ncbi:unnamed protein product [Miscanthus lutarioriparius]|uniref:Receptor kinase-like protein Xa21 n=1 Tax=Miscanthus lutarioriparius TaxID=422564 RepID=A0A811QK12_9POAL|nr:unnamed protein product [Miscanthus lutarioriparius]